MTVFAVRNFGCRVNRAEAFSWSERLRDGGLLETDDWMRSDLILVNSCTLTRRADSDVRRFVRRAGRENPGAEIIVTGCLAERAPETFAGIPQVRMILPNAAKDGLADRILAGCPAAVPMCGPRPPLARAVLKVQDGCDGRCAYCIIPSVRGPSRSRPWDGVLASAGSLAGRGYRELVLAGIDLASYGRDLHPRRSIADLAEAVSRVSSPARIRLSSLDPRSLETEEARRLAKNPDVRPHFHLSLQHASDGVLERMNRGRADSRQLALPAALREVSPDAALGADILVGFPGETEEDFETLFDYASASPLTYFHVFAYSPRPGTPAAGMNPRIPERARTNRSARVRRLSVEKSRAFRERFAGSVRPGIVVGRRNDGAAVLTDNYIEVDVPSCGAGVGDAVDVRVIEVLPRGARGEVVSR